LISENKCLYLDIQIIFTHFKCKQVKKNLQVK